VTPRARDLSPATLVVTAGRGDRAPDSPLSAPVVFASAYHAGGPVAYARDGNPTWSAFEEALGALEGGTALAFASGMSAISTVLEGQELGACVVAPADAYVGARRFLAERAQAGRFAVRWVDVTDTESVLASCGGARLLWLESPTNPTMNVADLPALISGAHKRGVTVAVDNTFATPLLQRPLHLGADIVVHSVTKLLAGHSDLLMGAAVVREQRLVEELRSRRSAYGGVPGPMETFLALRGIRTLAVRLDRAQATAAELARRLAEHPAVERVRYPGLGSDPGHERATRQMTGFGSMLSFEVRGGAESAEALAASVRVIVHATSLGGTESTIERRSRWPGEEGVPLSLLRMSVGCEDLEDLWDDLDRALHVSGARRTSQASGRSEPAMDEG
jgi:cystathionine gamma-synthase